MLTKLTGVLNRVLDEEARVQVGPFEYQVLIPEFVRRQIQTRTGTELTFHILEYYDGGQNTNRIVPRKIGFLSEDELDFFELFCTVDKIGSKKALKAMGRPIKEMADAIQRQDVKWLTTMPGIGKQSAEQIIATLKNKVTKFAMASAPRELPDGTSVEVVVSGNVFEDAYAALLTLGLSPVDARNRLDAAVVGGKSYTSVEDLISAVFART
ncbi:MAG TPA: Holliday junction branch migration protein RuvA [Gemmataceae bacterium]|jgi:Holliday junction DNA helicase RuvA|nr:Holliday junction branch migration protein RuvA [Gemmataceae bacterium]